jgi:two-component system cell cycle response regulator DivK
VAAALILVVDDYDDALVLYQDYLTFKGYDVITAKSGAEAITMARVHKPRLILMDIEMPKMSGTEAMHTLREDRAFDQVPIVAFTAHALENEKQAARQAGFDEVISKPCLLEELLAGIERLLGSPRIQSS